MSQYKLNTIEAHPFVQVRFLTILIFFYLFNGYTSTALLGSATHSPHRSPSPIINTHLPQTGLSVDRTTAIKVDQKNRTFLPPPIFLKIYGVNRTHLNLTWRYNYYRMSPRELVDNLTFVVQVATDQSSYEVWITLPGDRLSCLFPMGQFHRYHFRVVAVSGGMCSFSNSTETIIGQLGPSGPPYNLKVTKRDLFSISLQWESPLAETSLFNIYWSTDPAQIMYQNNALFQRSEDTTFTVNKLNPNQTYYFCVSVSTFFESVCSNLVNGSTLTPNLTSIGNVNVFGGFRNLTVQWDPPILQEGLVVNRYHVYYTAGNTFDPALAVKMTCNDTKCTLTEGIHEMQEYTIVVSYVVNREDESSGGWSLEGGHSSPVTAQVPPDAQSLTLQCTQCQPISGYTILLHWKVNGVAPGTRDLAMRLLVTDSHAETLLKNISLDSWSYNVTRLHPGTTYQFSLQLEDSLGYTSEKTLCAPCETKEAAPSVSPGSVKVVSNNSDMVNISWDPIPSEKQGGHLRYEVHIQPDQCGGDEGRKCEWCSKGLEHIETTEEHSVSLNLPRGSKFQVRVRGVTGGGTLYGPYTNPYCFKTPDGAPAQAPLVQHSTILGQGVCIEWQRLPRSLQYGDVEGYTVNVDSGLHGDIATYEQAAYNVTSDKTDYFIPVNTTENFEYNITVRGYTSVASGPESDVIKLTHDEVIRSGPNVSIWVSTSLHDPCGSVTLLWTRVANSTCGVYSMEVSYPAGKDERHHKVFPQSAASQMDISTRSLDANTEYIVELVVTFDGRVKIKTTATATMKVPKCPQNIQPDVIAVAIAVVLVCVCVVIIVVVLAVVCRARNRSRSLRDLPRYRERVRQNLNPYIRFPHRGNSTYQSSELGSVIDYDDQQTLLDDVSSHSGHALERFHDLSSNSSSSSDGSSKYLLSGVQFPSAVHSSKPQSQTPADSSDPQPSIHMFTPPQTSSLAQPLSDLHPVQHVCPVMHAPSVQMTTTSVRTPSPEYRPDDLIPDDLIPDDPLSHEGPIQDFEHEHLTSVSEIRRPSPEGQLDYIVLPNPTMNSGLTGFDAAV